MNVDIWTALRARELTNEELLQEFEGKARASNEMDVRDALIVLRDELRRRVDGMHPAYAKLALAAQKYLKYQVDGIRDRATAKAAERELNALVGRALGTCKCKHDFAHDKDCPFWPNIR